MKMFSKKKNVKAASDQNLILTDDTVFSIQEAYKALRTNVIFSLPGEGCKCIAVTGATQGCGKSTNAINLAISLAQVGKKVIVVDSDLRLPTVGVKLQLKNEQGLSNVLIGEADLKNVMQYDKEKKIYILTAGNIPPDSTVLLQSGQMKKVIRSLRELFDYIILDLPPILVATDACIVSTLVDGYLFVVKHGISEYRSVSAALDQLAFVDANVIGVVYAGAEIAKKPKYSGYYSYGKNKHIQEN